MSNVDTDKLILQARNGNPDSCLELMRQYAKGSSNVFKDPITAKKWGNRAIRIINSTYPSSEIDYKSFVSIKNKAENNDIESCIQLALFYATGTNNMFADLSISRKWIEKAVDLCSNESTKESTKEHNEQKKPLIYGTMPTLELKKLGNQGDKEACSELALRYQGWTGGVFKDELEAKKWREKAGNAFHKKSKKTSKDENAYRQNGKETLSSRNHSYKNNFDSDKRNSSTKRTYEGNLQARIVAKYKDFDTILDNSIAELQNLHFSNKEFVKLKNDIATTLKDTIVDLKHEVENNIKNVRWDKLVIAFFGETGAGKSTIIETFRILFDPSRPKNSDGLIVGDGQVDFTKDYHEYNLSINGHPFVLIDVPGIEGNEKDFKDVIQTALSKAHCVFYVQGHNKKPDSGTAEKIKKYLGDWAIVYSIQNVRGSVSNYDEEEERETLLTPGVIKNEGLIKQSFKAILGDVYKGNITVQALLAMCAKATFSEKTEYLQSLIRNQKKLIKYFGSADKILSFSQFQTLLNTVDSKSQNFSDEIAKANQQKLSALSLKIQRAINNKFSENKDGSELKLKMLKDFRRSVNSQLSGLGNKVESKAKSCIRREFNSLEIQLSNELDSSHDKENKKQFIRNKINRFPSELSQKLSRESGQQIEFVRNQLISQARNIQGVDFSRSLEFNFNTNINFDKETLEDGLSELDPNLDDVGDIAGGIVGGAGTGALIGSFIPGLGTAIGAGAGALIGAAGSLFSKGKFGDGGVSSAKESISDVLKRAQQSSMSKMKQSINEISYSANRKRTSLIKQIDDEIDSVEKIHDIVDELNEDINNIINQ